jgi:hypothetical protein
MDPMSQINLQMILKKPVNRAMRLSTIAKVRPLVSGDTEVVRDTEDDRFGVFQYFHFRRLVEGQTMPDLRDVEEVIDLL